MPPLGESAWHASSTTFQLHDVHGRVWAYADAPQAADSLSLGFPYVANDYDSFPVLSISLEDGRVSWRYTPSARTVAQLEWTAATPAGVLVPEREIRARERFHDAPDAPVIATVAVDGPGSIRVCDASGVPRMLVQLAEVSSAPWPEPSIAGELVAGGRRLVRFCYPITPAGAVRAVETSLP